MHNEKIFKKGSYVFLENDENSEFVYLVKEGRVSHLCSSSILSSALKDACDGDFFGFISSFSERPRLSSAIAVEDSIVIPLERDLLFRMLKEKTEIARKILNSYSHALTHYDSVLLDIKPITLIYPQNLNLLRLGEFYMEKGEKLLAQYIFNRYIQLFPDSENIKEIESHVSALETVPCQEFFKENDKGELSYRDGSVIFCEHEPGDLLYFIREGKVKIIKQSGDHDMLIAVLREGDIFGELALITSTPRSATAISFGGAVLAPVDMSMFKNLLADSPDLIKKILTSISQRLWFNHIRLGHMSYRNPVTRLFAFLESKLLEENVSLKRKIPYQFQFGLDELIDMNELSSDHDREVIDELVSNRLLSFNFGTITVTNPVQFSSEVLMYKQKDRFPVRNNRMKKVAEKQSFEDNGIEENILETESVDKETDKIKQSGLIEEEIVRIVPDLNSEDPLKRVNAVIRLGSLGESARNYVPDLRERLGDGVKIIRKNAARSIMKILPPGESFNVLRDALKEKSQEMRSSAVSGLGELKIADTTEIIELVIKALKDSSPLVRSSAVRCIGTFGVDAEQAVPALIKLLKDSESSVRILSVNALERITWTGVYISEVIAAVKFIWKNDTDRFVKNSSKDVLIKLNRRIKQR